MILKWWPMELVHWGVYLLNFDDAVSYRFQLISRVIHWCTSIGVRRPLVWVILGRVGNTDAPCCSLSYQDAYHRPQEEMKTSTIQQWMLLHNLKLKNSYGNHEQSYAAGEPHKKLLFPLLSYWRTSPYVPLT